MRYLLAIAAIASMAGCSQLDRYERTYTAAYDQEQGGSVSVTIRPLPQNKDIPPKYYIHQK